MPDLHEKLGRNIIWQLDLDAEIKDTCGPRPTGNIEKAQVNGIYCDKYKQIGGFLITFVFTNKFEYSS